MCLCVGCGRGGNNGALKMSGDERKNGGIVLCFCKFVYKQ